MIFKHYFQCLLWCVLYCFLAVSCTPEKERVQDEEYRTWSSYLGDPGRTHYSTLSQITPENVTGLKMAWSYEAPDWGQMQMSPLVVDSMLFGVTAALRVVALHAATGEEVWQFGDSVQVWHSTSRGVSYWEDKNDKRILCTRGPHLFALDALTGKPISSFGNNGKVDMRTGMHQGAREKFVISNTPGTIYKNLIVMPLRLSEGAGAAPGNIMAFNILTGAVEWVFHTIPHDDEEGYKTWETEDAYKSDIVGAANNWAGMAVDEERGIIYVPTGSAAPDFYGGVRKGSNLFANCLLALDANTGKRLWHFQFTHHDIWDRDPPAPPNLLTVKRNGEEIAAVAQVTKQGYVFVFDRETGEPLFDIEEVSVPTSELTGETTWPTQPKPLKPKPFARQSIDLNESNISPFAEHTDSLLNILVNADKRLYAPPSLHPVLLLPGYDGAAEWGGAAADPYRGILYVNANEMAWILQMGKADEDLNNLPLGEATYKKYCISCHQPDRKGLAASGFPSLIDIELRKGSDEIMQIITNGKGMMTGFPQLTDEEKTALVHFLFNQEVKHNVSEATGGKEIYQLPYKHSGYNKFLDSQGLPAINPPWGSLHAIDLNTGEYVWSIALGNTPELGDKGIGTGTENYGGPIVTENGLLFIAATRDGFLRVFNKHNGTLLWEYKLPAPSFSTPAMYEVNGKQYVALACGGEKLGTPKGNRIVAFALEP